MTIYSLYIYDRHCNCIYYADWHRTKRPKAANDGGLLPGVSRAVSSGISSAHTNSGTPLMSPRNTLTSGSGIVIAVGDVVSQSIAPASQVSTATDPPPSQHSLPFDEEAKLVYGVILSLRHMIKHLSGRNESFVSYNTSSYKLHLYETLSGYKFVMLSDPRTDSLRLILRSIHTGPFLEYVVRNPITIMDSRERGIDNEYFRASVDRLVRGLTIFP